MTLRPDQLQATLAVQAAYGAGLRAPVLVAPTGWGKTFWAVDWIQREIAQGRRVWFVAHLAEILLPTAKRLTMAGVRHGFIWGNHPEDDDALCQVVSVRTAVARAHQLIPPDSMIIDEADLAVAPGYQQLFDAMGRPRLLGLTGTPIRLDGQPMRAGGFDRLIATVDTVDLVADGGPLSPLRLWTWPSATVLDGFQLGRALDNWRRRAIDERGIRPTVAFCPTVAEAQRVAAEWSAAGFRAMAVDGGSRKADRLEAREGLAAGRLDLVACSDLWLAGVDIPEIAALICLRYTESVRVHLQMIGRLLRWGQAWPDVHLYDHMGNCRRPGLGSPLDRRAHLWSLDGDAGVGSMREAIRPVSTCGACYSTWVVNGRCQEPGCGWVRAAHLPHGPRIVEGALLEIDPRAALRAQREQAEQEKAALRQQRKEEERDCWINGDRSGSARRFQALAMRRQQEAGRELSPAAAWRWAQLQVSLRDGTRYPTRQRASTVRRVG